MRTFLLIATVLLSIKAPAIGKGTGDIGSSGGKVQTWSCYLNDQTSAIRMAREFQLHPTALSGRRNEGPLHMAEVTAFSIQIQNGKIVGGEAFNSAANPNPDGENSRWDFKDTLQAQTPEQDDHTYVRNLKTTAQSIKFNFGYSFYDHFEYAVTIDKKTKKAVLTARYEEDCGDPSTGLGVYDCEPREE